MNTATLPSPTTTPTGVRLLTAADVAALPDRLPSGPVKYELHDGKLIVMAPPGDIHGFRQVLFGSYLFLYGQQGGYGQARGAVGVLLSRYPDHLVAPDAAFLTTAQLPPRTSPTRLPDDHIPELVVEVRSKNDTQPEVDAKVNDYLTAGVVLVWVADPDARTVTAYQANQPPVVFTATDALTALPVIPGFAVLVGDLLPV